MSAARTQNCLILRTLDPNTRNPCNIDMPLIGFGTYKFKKGSGEAETAVIHALQVGYRSIDTAFIYGGEQTEKEVGRALGRCTLANTTSSTTTATSDGSTKVVPVLCRKDIFLTTKQWRAYHGYEPTLQCFQKSLDRLQTDYVDLYLIHWPGPAYNTMNRRKDVMTESSDGPFVYAKQDHEMDQIQHLRAETWRAMEDLLYQGKCRAIGVSNFTIRHLEALKKTARVWPPAVNQIECHPYNPQRELVEYCKKEGIAVVAYASLGGQDTGKKRWNILGGKLLERLEIQEIGKRYNKTTAQVLLRWATQQGIGVIPKSGNVEHMKQSLEAVQGDWTPVGNGDGDDHDDDHISNRQQQQGLTQEDMQIINNLDQSKIVDANDDGNGDVRWNENTRLCWVRDPLKMLDFD